MAQIPRIDVTKQNCWLCDHFRRNNGALADPNKGSCTARAPKARSAIPGSTAGTTQNIINATIANPTTTFCGDFKKWFGTARELIPVVE
jgi:hypothetical protein